MNPWIAKAVIFVAGLVMVIIRTPHGERSRAIKVVKSRKGRLEVVLLALAWLGFFVPLIWTVTPLLAIADYPLRLGSLAAGTVCLAAGLWFFYRSHADLGRNWSITLEVRERHQLITHGIYRSIRHPMYLALLLYSAGQALAVPNWVAGPWFLLAMVLLFALRVSREERMMLDEFGGDYAAYMARTKRLIPRVW